MSHILSAFNDHIRRVARREIRAQMSLTRKAAAQHRHEFAALRRLIDTMASRLAVLETQGGRPTAARANEPLDRLRFRSDGLRSHRAKLGLSAKDYGRLVGVSGLTVYHWEAGKAKPRRRQLAALAAVRGLGKREALRRLADKK